MTSRTKLQWAQVRVAGVACFIALVLVYSTFPLFVLASNPVDKCGIYNWFSNGENIDCTPVNFPSEESDLRCLSDKEVKAMGVFTADNGGQVRSLHEGVELWPFLVIFALLICFIEQFVMIWAEKR